jgi:hypothetical protein
MSVYSAYSKLEPCSHPCHGPQNWSVSPFTVYGSLLKDLYAAAVRDNSAMYSRGSANGALNCKAAAVRARGLDLRRTNVRLGNPFIAVPRDRLWSALHCYCLPTSIVALTWKSKPQTQSEPRMILKPAGCGPGGIEVLGVESMSRDLVTITVAWPVLSPRTAVLTWAKSSPDRIRLSTNNC